MFFTQFRFSRIEFFNFPISLTEPNMIFLGSKHHNSEAIWRFPKIEVQLNHPFSQCRGKGGRSVGFRRCAVTLPGAGGAATLRRSGGGWRCNAATLPLGQ